MENFVRSFGQGQENKNRVFPNFLFVINSINILGKDLWNLAIVVLSICKALEFLNP